MFAKLLNYRTQEYYEAHPVMYLNTPGHNYRVDIFSAYITPDTSDTYTCLFADRDSYQEDLEKMAGQSVIQTDITPDTNHRIVTLSTCTYEYEDARFIG